MLTDAQIEEMMARVRKLGVADAETMGRGKLLDELFKEHVEPKLWDPVFIVDYPRELSPLAKPKRGNAALVERFELMVAGREIANAFSELNDPLDQRERFLAQVRLREAGGRRSAGGEPTGELAWTASATITGSKVISGASTKSVLKLPYAQMTAMGRNPPSARKVNKRPF